MAARDIFIYRLEHVVTVIYLRLVVLWLPNYPVVLFLRHNSCTRRKEEPLRLVLDAPRCLSLGPNQQGPVEHVEIEGPQE